MLMIKKTQKKFFSLIEIVLAIGVLTVGIAAVMSLVPVGLNSYRDAMADNDGAQNAETMLRILENKFTKDKASFDDLLATSFPKTRYKKAGGVVADIDISSDPTELSSWTLVNSGLYEIEVGNGLYGFASPDKDKADFVAHVLIWRDDVHVLEWDGATSTWAVKQDASSSDLVSTDVVRLNVELSWPVAKPYSSREKRLFTLEVYNKNANKTP